MEHWKIPDRLNKQLHYVFILNNHIMPKINKNKLQIYKKNKLIHNTKRVTKEGIPYSKNKQLKQYNINCINYY